MNKELKPPFEPSIFGSNFDPEYVRDSSIATLNRPRVSGIATEGH